MTQLKKPILLSATTKPIETRTFYEDKLGFLFISEDNFAIVFKIDDLDLRVQKVQTVVQVPYTSLGWAVENIEKVVDDLSFKGIVFELFDQLEQTESGIWKSPGGAKIAWFKDPDGNILSITEYSN